MGSIRILLGKSRRRRRRAVPASMLSGVDTVGRPTFLYVTDTWRKKQVVEREFVAWRSAEPVFSPPVRVLSELFVTLYLRHGPGRAILGQRSCEVVAARVLAQAPHEWPWLAAMGAPRDVGAALADLHAAMAEARVTRLDAAPHAEDLHRALHAYDRALGQVAGFATLADALEDLLALLPTPPPALLQWLRSTHSVVLDDILQPSPLRAAVLVALCRAWRDAGTHVVLSLETGRDLGGAEVESFFEYGDVDPVAVPLKPFVATRALRRTLFAELIATGEASIHLALADGVIEVEPATVFAPPEPPDLSDHVYGPRPVPAPATASDLLRGKLRFVHCDDPGAEVRFVAGEVKRTLLAGATPGDCVVAVPDLRSYGPALRAAFDDHGIPYTLTAGLRLASVPLTHVVRGLLALGAVLEDDDSVATRAGALASLARWDLVAVSVASDAIDAVSRWVRRVGPASSAPLPDALAPAMAALDTAFAGAASLRDPCTPELWRRRFVHALATLGLPGTLERVGPDAVVGASLHAWGGILRAVDAVVAELSAITREPWPAGAIAEEVDRALQDATFLPGPGGQGRVQVVGVLELRGLSPPHTWLVGLSRGSFPTRPATPFLVPRRIGRALQSWDPLAEARYLFCSLLRNAIDDDNMRSLTVTWPATRDGRPSAAAPVLEDLLSVPTAASGGPGPLLGVLLTSTPSGHAPCSRSDALRAAARSDAWLEVLTEAERAALLRQRAVTDDRSRRDRFGRFDGVLDRPPDPPATMGVTTLETYLKCPARYWYAHVLELKPEPTFDPDVDARAKGIALHSILEQYIKEREYRPFAGEDIQRAGDHLHQVAVRVLDDLGRRGGHDPALRAAMREGWLAGLTDRRPAGLLKAWLIEEIREGADITPFVVELPIDLPLGRTRLRGQVDRIDRTSSGDAIVTDYKSGRAPSHAAVLQGLAIQPVAYAAAARARLPDTELACAYYELKEAQSVRKKGWIGDTGAIARLLPAAEAKRALMADERVRAALLAHAAEGTERLAAGQFHTTLADPGEVGCRWCDYRRICRLDPVRAARIAEADDAGRWQAPRETE